MDYKALDLDWNEIRLLTFLPQDADGRIRCRLDHASLINAPAYAALSYCWGDPTPVKSIVINDVEVEIGPNLESALRCLQSRGYDRLWVDAICINQQDNVEKSQQLLWMGSIYRRATRVAAWVDGEADDSDKAIELIRKLSDNSLELESIEQNTTSLIALRTLLSREYWRRVWVIQELAFAREAIKHCGRQSLPWKTLHSALEICVSAPDSENLDALVSSPGFENALGLAKFHVDASNNKPIHFLDALQRSVKSLASEPRDKIFALWGLAYDSGIYLPVPNYRQPIHAISRGITISAMITTASLDILPLLGSGFASPNLPSWVPNWFQLEDFSLERRIHYLHHDKYIAHQLSEMPTVSDHRLRVKGVVVDEVDGLCATKSEAVDSRFIYVQTNSTAAFDDSTKIGIFLEAMIRTLTRKTIYNYTFADISSFVHLLWFGDSYWAFKSAASKALERLGSWRTATASFLINGITLGEWSVLAGKRFRVKDILGSESKVEQVNPHRNVFMTFSISVFGPEQLLL